MVSFRTEVSNYKLKGKGKITENQLVTQANQNQRYYGRVTPTSSSQQGQPNANNDMHHPDMGNGTLSDQNQNGAAQTEIFEKGESGVNSSPAVRTTQLQLPQFSLQLMETVTDTIETRVPRVVYGMSQNLLVNEYTVMEGSSTPRGTGESQIMAVVEELVMNNPYDNLHDVNQNSMDDGNIR
ncbi:unnamed protein product [Dovyalis caffra]|uniref:Uncharacterized protein n=1 Tax=Dovyalis caffra TaxID=77055 RepID=A0AAV1R5K2_9ROSI|nr:unnamed protein product [Dovyalis caffra]